MKILSLNVNNFAGRGVPKPVIKDFNTWFEFRKAVVLWRDNVEHYRNAGCILDLIKENNPDIVFLQEFDVTSDMSVKFIRTMNLLGYEEKYPDNNKVDSGKGIKSITIMFTKLPNTIVKSNKNLVDGSLKWVNAEIGDLLISGVHFNYTMEYWDALERFYSLNKDRKLLVIGDLNVYIKGTDRRDRFDNILSMGIEDMWLYSGGSNDTITCDTGARLDYALASKSLRDNIFITINDTPINRRFSDHNALIVSIV